MVSEILRGRIHIYEMLRLCVRFILFVAGKKAKQDCARNGEHDRPSCPGEISLSHPSDHREGSCCAVKAVEDTQKHYYFCSFFVLPFFSFLLFPPDSSNFLLSLKVTSLIFYFNLLSSSCCPLSPLFLRVLFILSFLFHYISSPSQLLTELSSC
jgi:hypothetical protein